MSLSYAKNLRMQNLYEKKITQESRENKTLYGYQCRFLTVPLKAAL